jgi:hypothetical protein
VHYWHDSNNPVPWSPPVLITNQATSAACFFQSDYGADDDDDGETHGNFELVVREGLQLVSYYRDNGADAMPWIPIGPVAPHHKCSGPACVFQGNYGKDPVHGNFELVVPEGGRVVHYYRDNSRDDFPWYPTTNVSVNAFSFRSDFNRNLATLEFYPQFGASMLAAGAVAGPTQDNGNVNGMAGDNGTPWFITEGGDGAAAFYLSGHSPYIPGNLAAGLIEVNENNEGEETNDLIGSKSEHWQSGYRLLVPDDHGKGTSVIRLDIPKPGVTPIPDADKGLRRPPGILYAPVRAPENFPKGMILAAIAAQGPDVYALMVAETTLQATRGKKILMHWEFSLTVPNVPSIDAIASANGLHAIAGVQRNGKFVISPLDMVLLDLTSKATSSMALAPAINGIKCVSIAIVSETEAYAIVESPKSFIDPILVPRVICWDGKQWMLRGQPSLGPKEPALISIAADPTSTPTAVFVASKRHVHVSRDAAATWVRASKNLPNALDCQALHWVRDEAGAHLYLATFGRSMWVASARQGW